MNDFTRGGGGDGKSDAFTFWGGVQASVGSSTSTKNEGTFTLPGFTYHNVTIASRWKNTDTQVQN